VKKRERPVLPGERSRRKSERRRLRRSVLTLSTEKRKDPRELVEDPHRAPSTSNIAGDQHLEEGRERPDRWNEILHHNEPKVDGSYIDGGKSP